MSQALVPRDGNDFKAALDTLSLNFSLAPEIQARLLSDGLSHLEELRFFFDNEEHVGRWVAKLSLGDKTMLETSRLRRAWAAVRLYFSTSEQDRSRVALTDLDTLLEDSELRDVKLAFWKRYRMRFPAEVHPADSLLSRDSRVSREINKRMLCVYAIWKVRSLYFQLTTVQRKRKLGDNLFTEEPDTEEAVTKDADTYLDKLYTLLLAYSMAMVFPLPGVDMSKEAALSASSAEFVGVPLDDVEERSEWVTRFREGNSSLGLIIKQVMEARDARWVVTSAALSVGPGETQVAAGTAIPPPPVPQVSHFREGPKVGGKRVAAVLKDGTKLCPDFQSGKCKGLKIDDQRRVSKDNCACQFVLEEQQRILERGGGAIRENPNNSLHWCIPQEAEMWASDQWWDTRYDACCFMGARRKRQRLRHNIWELTQGPSLLCHHTHHPQEWQPWEANGRVVYPSKDEAEYTAPLAFHIACVGRREHWLEIDSRALREWAMSCLAITLGLRPIDPGEAARVPVRVEVASVLREDKSLPPDVIYVGRGHRSHRLPVTQWASPFVSGHNCDADEWLALYTDLVQLEGRTLACDCALNQVCEGDLLAGLVFDAGRPQGIPHQGAAGRPRRAAQKRSRRVLLAAAASALPTPVGAMIPYLHQDSVVATFQSFFPGVEWGDFRFPMVQDLVNAPPFTDYVQWCRDRHEEWDGPLLPQLVSAQQRQWQRTAEGQQVGAVAHRAALPPALPFGLQPDVHFDLALELARYPTPFEQPPALDLDLCYAAEVTASKRGSLREWRRASLGAIRELKRRWAGVDSRLRASQQAPLRRVTRKRDIGLLALLCLLVSWGDPTLPHDFLFGMAAVGTAPVYGVFPLQSARDISHAEVLADASASNARVRASLRPGRDDAFLLEQSLRDAESGFCSEPLRYPQLLRAVGGLPFRLIPRCVITQSSGKQRIIDNADTGGQSELSSDPNKLVLCSPLRPAQHAAALLACLDESSRQRAAAEDALEGGGEDWPEAYRHYPMDGASSRCCVVVWWHTDWGEPAYQLYTGLLFGLPLAVTSFNRYSRAAEALGRRLLAILVSMYFDDAHLTDWASSKGSAQSSFGGLNACLGSPFAPAKRQPMALTGTFLGLNFDFEGCLHSGVVRFFVRDRLVSKVHDMLDQAVSSNSLSPGLAAKLYGTCNFLEQGMYGRVGAGGLRAIRERSDEGGRELTPPILACFSLIRAVLAVRPEREFEVLRRPVARFCAASDAAEDIPGAGSGGFHLVWLDSTEVRESFIAHIGPEVYAQFTPGEHKIAQLELAMVLYALAVRAPSFRGRRGYWYIDNVAALMSLIRGRSSSPDLECLAQLIHIAMFALRTSFFFEYIPSKTNWADAVSRIGFAELWLHQRGFSCHVASFPFQLVGLPFLAVLRVFEFL
ncbi:unnamed protein product [Symbiodinium sp. CCMP2592]|nr:unnamed protein product [Symbiodinium sp. CCMP2592]